MSGSVDGLKLDRGELAEGPLASSQVYLVSIQVTIASRSCSRVSHRWVSRTSFCSREKNDSMAALSQAAPTRPMEPTRSLLSSSRRTFLEPNWLPRSGCRIVPAGLRNAMALRIADAASRHPTRPVWFLSA